MKFGNHHLAYCTNVHPAESWAETFHVLKTDVLAVRDRVSADQPFAIGLRLSALAATELLSKNHLPEFQDWLTSENCYLFTINGFPFGAFHHTRVKENVYRPDWTSPERLTYTQNLFQIIAQLAPTSAGGSVSTLPGSFKEFQADESLIFQNLYACAQFIHALSQETSKDLHLGLEPEPLGHFENTAETIAFFDRFHSWCQKNHLNPELITQHLGVNYDTCHFALEFDDCTSSLEKFAAAGIRISKIHLSNALAFNPQNPEALAALHAFDEPTYLHQVILNSSPLTRFKDLPEFFAHPQPHSATEARCHFHIPLYAQPLPPLSSTHQHATEALNFLKKSPQTCSHLEIETYTWNVLPQNLQTNLSDQITAEYEWVLKS